MSRKMSEEQEDLRVRRTHKLLWEALMAELSQRMRQMYDVFLAEVDEPPGAFSPDNPPPYFVHLFEHVAQHQQFYRLMLCGEGIGRFQKQIKEYVAEVASTRLPTCLS